MFFLYGVGANGKSTFLNTLAEMLGDYASTTPTSTLMVKKNEGIPNDIARLKGLRFVMAAETEMGKALAESSPGETFTAFADIDIAALRAARRKNGMTNFLSRQRLALFAPVYGADTHQPADSLMRDGEVTTPDRDHFVRVQEQIIDRLSKEGLI